MGLPLFQGGHRIRAGSAARRNPECEEGRGSQDQRRHGIGWQIDGLDSESHPLHDSTPPHPPLTRSPSIIMLRQAII